MPLATLSICMACFPLTRKERTCVARPPGLIAEMPPYNDDNDDDG